MVNLILHKDAANISKNDFDKSAGATNICFFVESLMQFDSIFIV
jgi:hypothetical protein